MSGGPLFTLVQSDIFYWRLAGVLTEFNSSWEILFASSIARVGADGKIADKG